MDWGELKSKKRALFFQAFKGWRIWHKIVKKYKMKTKKYHSTAVVLMPINDLENTYYALLYLDRMLSRRDLKFVVILTANSLVCKVSKLLCKKLRGVEMITEESAESLLQFYALYPFDSRFIAASLTDPHGRNGKELDGICGITVEELVAIGVYNLIPYSQMDRPKYNGEDDEIKTFMSIGGENLYKRTTRKIR